VQLGDVLQEEQYKILLETVQNSHDSIPRRTTAVLKAKGGPTPYQYSICNVSIILSNPCRFQLSLSSLLLPLLLLLLLLPPQPLTMYFLDFMMSSMVRRTLNLAVGFQA
jgi:hypothetical protein